MSMTAEFKGKGRYCMSFAAAKLFGTMLIHRLMLNDEIRAVESHLDDYAIKHVRKLNQGEVILTSVNLLHNMFIHVNKSPRTQHNDTPQL